MEIEKLKPRNNSVKQELPLKGRRSFENETLLGNDRPEQVLFQHSNSACFLKKFFAIIFAYFFNGEDNFAIKEQKGYWIN